jgi:hypothetical protein
MIHATVSAAPWVALLPLVWANLRHSQPSVKRICHDRDSM